MTDGRRTQQQSGWRVTHVAAGMSVSGQTDYLPLVMVIFYHCSNPCLTIFYHKLSLSLPSFSSHVLHKKTFLLPCLDCILSLINKLYYVTYELNGNQVFSLYNLEFALHGLRYGIFVSTKQCRSLCEEAFVRHLPAGGKHYNLCL